MYRSIVSESSLVRVSEQGRSLLFSHFDEHDTYIEYKVPAIMATRQRPSITNITIAHTGNLETSQIPFSNSQSSAQETQVFKSLHLRQPSAQVLHRLSYAKYPVAQDEQVVALVQSRQFSKQGEQVFWLTYWPCTHPHCLFPLRRMNGEQHTLQVRPLGQSLHRLMQDEHLLVVYSKQNASQQSLQVVTYSKHIRQLLLHERHVPSTGFRIWFILHWLETCAMVFELIMNIVFRLLGERPNPVIPMLSTCSIWALASGINLSIYSDLSLVETAITFSSLETLILTKSFNPALIGRASSVQVFMLHLQALTLPHRYRQAPEAEQVNPLTVSSGSVNVKSFNYAISLVMGSMLYIFNLDCLPQVLLPPAVNYRLRIGEHASDAAGISPNLIDFVDLSENLYENMSPNEVLQMRRVLSAVKQTEFTVNTAFSLLGLSIVSSSSPVCTVNTLT